MKDMQVIDNDKILINTANEPAHVIEKALLPQFHGWNHIMRSDLDF